MRTPRIGWLVCLTVLVCSITASPPVPPIQCPVGVSIQAALYFKTLDGGDTPASVTSSIRSLNESLMRKELEVELEPNINLGQIELENLSDSELVNLASLYYGLTKSLNTNTNTTTLDRTQLRELAEVELESHFSGPAKEYLRWTMGSLSDQELILIACGAEFMVPTDFPFPMDGRCYAGSDSYNLGAVTTFSSPGVPCRQKCRAEEFKVYLSKVEDGSCYCTNSGLQSRATTCDDSTFFYRSSGIGLPLLSQHLQPTGYNSTLNQVKDSVSIEVAGLTYNVVLFEQQVAVFRLDAPSRWEDSDDLPSISFVDNRKWDDDATNLSFEDLEGEKNLVELQDSQMLPQTGTDYKMVEQTVATSMVVLPIFVQMDEQFYPDRELKEGEGDDYYYDDATWFNNLASRPHPGGKWFYHILIVHKSKRRVPPTMTMIRILDNGTLVHMMEWKMPHNGRFKVPELNKEVVQMLPLVRGTESFFLTASITPTPKRFSPEIYNKLQAWKMTENEDEITASGKTSFFQPVEHSDPNQPIKVYNEVKLAKIDFLFKMFIAVLDRSSHDGADSRVRIFSFAYSALRKDYYLDTDPVTTEVFSGQVFTNLHSFVHEGIRYIVLSNAETLTKLFSVSSNGEMSEVGSGISSLGSEGVLVDLMPTPEEFSSSTDLLEVRKVGNSTSVQVHSFDPAQGNWVKDSYKMVSSVISSYDYNSTLDVTRVLGERRLVCSNVRAPTDGNSLDFDLLMIPRLPSHQVDQRLRYESQIAVKIYDLDWKISKDGGQYLNNLHSEAKANVDQHLQQNGSLVTGHWSISGVDTSTVSMASIPVDTKVTLHNGEEDWRDVLDINMTVVEEKLNDLRSKVDQMSSLDADLLELNTGRTQEVTTSLTVENLTVAGTLDYSGPHPFIVEVLASDNESLSMSSITNIFSCSQNNAPILGTTTFNKSSTFNGGLDSVKLASEFSDGQTVTVTTANLLRLVGGQTISEPQVLMGGITVETDLEFADGVGVTSSELEGVLNLADIPVNNLSGPFTLNQVVVEGSGLSAPHFHDSFPSNLDISMLIPKDAESVNITGTLSFQSENFESFGSVGVAGNVNDKDILDVFENAVWRDAPESIDTISFDTTLTFPGKAQFTGDLRFGNGLEVDEINGIGFQKYLQTDSLQSCTTNKTLKVGGVKTLESPSFFDEILASTFNSLTLDQLVDKHSAQAVPASTFQAEVSVEDILAGESASPPSVDGVDLAQFASTNIQGIIAGEVEGSTVPISTSFSTIEIAPGARLTIRDRINNIDLLDRVPNIVRSDEASVNITGDKTFSIPVSVNTVKIKKINTYDTITNSYNKSFAFGDFVNTRNPQTFGSGKTFSGNVTFADMFFIKADSKINDIKIAPLLECWVDINSTDEVVVDEPVKFMSLVTDGLKITRSDPSSRKCDDVKDSILSLEEWLVGKPGVQEFSQEITEEEMTRVARDYLQSRCPPGSLENVITTGEAGLTGITYLTVTIEEMGKTVEDLATMNVSSKRNFVNHRIANTRGIYLSQLEAMTTFDVVKTSCRVPFLNNDDIVSGVARLSADNHFCSAVSPCNQIFSADLESNSVQVGGDVQTNKPVFGVTVSSLGAQRVSLSSPQTLSGNYIFSHLSLNHSFQGEILYHHAGSDLSLADYSKKFLRKSGDQTFTESGLSFSTLSASSSVKTGDQGVSREVTVGGAQCNVKTVYEEHFKYNEDITITQNLTLTDELKVSQNIAVGGDVQGVDISSLAADLVISGGSVEVPAGGGETTGYSISGTDDTVTFTGKKTFTLPPRIHGDILVTEDGGDLSPVVVTDSKEIQFSASQSETRMMMRGVSQDISSSVTVDGSVEFLSGLSTDRIGGVNVVDIYNKYEYDSSGSMHVIKTSFDFQGTLNVSQVKSDLVRGQNWTEFVADTIPMSSSDIQNITGDKIFSGQVTIDSADTALDTFNDINLDSVYEDQAFIDQPVMFTSVNSFTYSEGNQVTVETGNSLRAKTSLTLVDPEIQTDDVENPVFDVAFVYSNSILIQDSAPVNVTGKLKFPMITLKKDSNVESLVGTDNFNILIPENLILLNSTSVSFSVGNVSHQFAGAKFDSDLKLTGTVGGHNLEEFDNVLYKSTDFRSTKTFSGQKIFEKVTLAQDLNSSGEVNGLNLLDNLVYLDGDNKTLIGSYNFEEIELNNLKVTGLLDTVDWDDIQTHLFYTNVVQNITANFTFAVPTSLTFQGSVIGDGDNSNGRGTINNLPVESIMALDSTWKAVGDVKTAAQAEASVLCGHVKALANSYLANMKVSYYTYHANSPLTNASSFGDVVDLTTLTLGDTVVIVAISPNKIRLLNRIKTDNVYDVVDFPGDGLELEMKQDDGTPVENARHIEVVADIVTVESVAFMAIVITDNGAVLVRISGNLGGSNITISQVGGLIPGMVGITFIPEISTFFVAFQLPHSEGGFSMQVRSLHYPDYYFRSLLECLEGGRSNLFCLKSLVWDPTSNMHLCWQGQDFQERIPSPHLDAYLESNQVFLAVSNHFGSSSTSYVSSLRTNVSLSRGANTDVWITGDQLLLPNPGSDDFVLLSSNHHGLLITGGEEVTVTKINYDENSLTKVSRFPLANGPASQLRRHSNGLISALEDNKNLVFLKYAGLNGVKVDRTLHLENQPVLTYTFFNPISGDKVSDNLLFTANRNNDVDIYTSKANFEGKTMDIQCRNPEVSESKKNNNYCDISAEHTMCKFNKKSESCSISKNNLTQLTGFDSILLAEHNRYRSLISTGNTSRSDLPTAGDMRFLTWDFELARLAEMWAAQCSSEHESVRKVIINGNEFDYGQNLIAFKAVNDWEVGEDSMKEMVRYWYSEVSSVELDHLSSYTYKSETEHFTQLAWSRTEKIGCGWTQYVDQGDSHPFVSLVVCNYLVEGNKDTQPVYSQGPPCSNCPTDYTCIETLGLCERSSYF